MARGTILPEGWSTASTRRDSRPAAVLTTAATANTPEQASR